MDETNRYLAPGKLNLFLHINGRRDDGYHELQTLFQFIDFADEIAIDATPCGPIEFTTDMADINTSDNLIVKAAHALKSYSYTQQGAQIQLVKKLPMGAGVGGGSSDAATTLMVLNQLWKLDLPLSELATIGRKLGADVPIFIFGQAAFAEGIGDIMTMATIDEPWYLLLAPKVSVSTAEIFCNPDLPRDTPKLDLTQFNYNETRNDCQTIVVKNYPEVAQALQWLVEYAPARMTGTGSCIFAPFTDEHTARAAAKHCPAEFSARICRGLNRSPLHQQLIG
ncbi:MAG: 4-diphosphocytidyl-2-C-methyl-D-erythritol kinase [Candidatus Celerinatantimonas neptuna]|nr:MAG: 4-diphosphocytidyl-2-C-methyl-D-erythritol kinase [Candidatus Celerinatantimonas neptuna]